MAEKHPGWTRARVGRDRVHWVAYDDRAGSEDRRIVDQGYAASLPEADAAAKAALADAGLYGGRRISPGFGRSAQGGKDRPPAPASPARAAPSRPREYVYSRVLTDLDDAPLVAAHLVVKRTARKVYVTLRSCGPDQIGTDDEAWDPNDRTIALDRAKLESDGSVYSGNLRGSDFHATREGAAGESSRPGSSSLAVLGLRSPCTVEEIKAAYRRAALASHPDRGGKPGDFQAVEAAYRRLLREAQAPGE